MSEHDGAVGQAQLFEPPPAASLSLRDRFLVPPFSVLDARQGYWQARKQAWLNLGIKGELGAEQLLTSGDGRSNHLLHSGTVREEWSGQWDVSKGESAWGGGAGTSIFDPVLCELVYRWFAPRGGLVGDPFAGGSVRGIVAAALGLRYRGTDLSLQQVEANYQQAGAIGRVLEWQHGPVWEHGDARNFTECVEPGSADLIFTCPPYYDLEVYTDHPQDLSRAKTYAEFLYGYAECLHAAASALRPNRFYCVVVGDVRDKRTGAYHGLVPDTIHVCKQAGLHYYNEAILVTSVGSLPIRTSRLFPPGRKLGKSHQQLLVFVKGSWREACAASPFEEYVALDYGV